MKRLIVIFSLIGILTACINDDNTGADVKVGDSLPSFEVVMNDGSVMTDAELRGTVSLLMFFHPSCPDCQQALPIVQTIYDEYTTKGVVFFLISRECGNDEVSVFWEKNGLKMPYSAQTDRSIYELFASSLIPRIYISDENGTVRYIFTDDPVPSYEVLKSSLESLIR